MAKSQQPQSNDIDIDQLGHGLRNSFKPLIILAVLFGVATFGVSSMMTERYSSEARLAILKQSAQPISNTEKGRFLDSTVHQRLDRETINKHVQAIQERGLLLKVATALKLSEKEEFGFGQAPLGPTIAMDGVTVLTGAQKTGAQKKSDSNEILNIIRRRLEIYAASDNSYISIKFSSADKELAANFVNTLAESYQQRLINWSGPRPQPALNNLSSLRPRVEQLRAEVLAAETEVKRLRVQNNVASSGSQSTQFHTQQLANLTKELDQAVIKRDAARLKWRAARDTRRNGNLENLPEIQNSPVIQRLSAQRTKFGREAAEARVLFSPRHPIVQQLRSDAMEAERLMQREVVKIERKLERQFRQLDLMVKNIRREINTFEPRATSLPGRLDKLESLEKIAQSKRSELERMQRQLEDTTIRVSYKSEPVDAQILSFGQPSGEPDFPPKLTYTLLAIASVFVIGIASVAAKEIMTGEDKSTDGQPQFQAPKSTMETGTMAALPKPENEPDGINTYGEAYKASDVELNPQPTLSATASSNEDNNEIVRKVAVRLINKSQDISGYRTMITGDHQAIDVSREGMMLADIISRTDQQVAVIDWNVKGEASAEQLGITVKAGIFELLVGAATFEDIIASVPGSTVDYICTGNSLEFEDHNLDINGLNAFLNSLDDMYSHIIVMSRLNAAKTLFEAVKGHFYTGIILVEEMPQPAPIEHSTGNFIGFEVTDIDVIRCAKRVSESGLSLTVRKAEKTENTDL